MANGVEGGVRATCRRHQRSANAARQRHNATQTPDSVLSWNQRPSGGGGLHGCHHGVNAPMCCCCTNSTNNNNSNCCGLGNGGELSGEVTCHCHHITHHCHHYSPVGGGETNRIPKRRDRDRERSSKRRSKLCSDRRNRVHHHHNHHHRHHNHHHHQYAQHHHASRHLPIYNTKSSFDSSDEQLSYQHADHKKHHRRSPHLQEIAIEIDAATMTEDNTSTATSNFAYKMATEIMAPIIMAPMHDDEQQRVREKRKRQRQRTRRRERRHDSLNSNTTIETDELSQDNDDEDDELTPQRSTRTTRTEEEGGDDTSPRAICCNDAPKNECVKIKRKRFIAAQNSRDYCSSCSRCSSCSCQHTQHTSSCSSIDDLVADEEHLAHHHPHELIVSADCHRCTLHRQSTTTSTTGEDDDDRDADEGAANSDDCMPPRKRLVHEATTDSSARTSRRSSESFCSCQSTSCCYCSCSCDECEAMQMRTARETITSCSVAAVTATSAGGTAEFDEQHSSTLTPLTNPSSCVSTPLADDADATLRSFSHVLGDDASSLSQSAEYFSLSSNQQSQATPTHATPTHGAAKSAHAHLPHTRRPLVAADAAITTAITTTPTVSTSSNRNKPPCKHHFNSKHHRHKRFTPPLDAYL